MMKFTLPVLAAAAILPLVASADVRIDVNGTKDGIKIQKTAGEGFSGGKASWLPEGQQEQRLFLQKKVSKEYQEFSFAFTPTRTATSGSPSVGTGMRIPPPVPSF